MHVIIVGIRGVPAMHGGFETFAEHLSPFLTARNDYVTVCCQIDNGSVLTEDVWRLQPASEHRLIRTCTSDMTLVFICDVHRQAPQEVMLRRNPGFEKGGLLSRNPYWILRGRRAWSYSTILRKSA